ncbi:hypothetical protein HZP56_10965 [Elizabethkingia anophelis]|nr:hypothetical protein [Elizabethkingia anophelis]MCT4177353.1 hypothetical protein [Elizabethkingia anophelis]
MSIKRQSSLVVNNIRIDMSRSDIEAKIGQPNKIGAWKDSLGNYIDTLYYREELYTKETGYNNVENILIFKNSILTEIRQGKALKIHNW